ncbi:LPS O-antigen length regulator [Pseudoalteromonas citrea]|uniref:LPS O-antigen length regulator n=1 Tax=Pseudoalteromonas citrea TaxID=43655 RepID=A0A5S3XR55_9GAMM|nr:Wzz/FepE/Etk N-terminal domain-containing protein [Pseudoalteromonas citrea]TMP45677.1 LPS O-antigen length regulator [Pseudoalteromonas citrea]TMP59056.1 LPS O-antigen length regulator [Pseudoalteromonas citrea]
MEIKESDIVKSHEVDLTEILRALWQGKVWIVLLSAVFSIGGVFYALSLPNEYKATVILSPVEDTQGGMLGGLKSDLGGLAAMAGVNLGGGGSNKSALALQILKSRGFLNEFVEKYDLKATLMGTNGWDLSSNTLLYNEKVYDDKTGQWLREVAAPRTPEPSVQEVYEYILGKNLSVIEDKKKGLVWFSITHYSPYVAKDLVEKLVVEINARMQKDDIQQATTKIEYLKKTLAETTVADMHKIFYQLIEQQEQTKMLALTQSQYVFRTIDPAILPEIKDGPKRAFICIGFAFAGLVLSFGFVLFRYFVMPKTARS